MMGSGVGVGFVRTALPSSSKAACHMMTRISQVVRHTEWVSIRSMPSHRVGLNSEVRNEVRAKHTEVEVTQQPQESWRE